MFYCPLHNDSCISELSRRQIFAFKRTQGQKFGTTNPYQRVQSDLFYFFQFRLSWEIGPLAVK